MMTDDQIATECKRMVDSGLLDELSNLLEQTAFDQFRNALSYEEYINARAFLEAAIHLRTIVLDRAPRDPK